MVILMKLFLIYATLGWILEIIFISYGKKKIINTHFLFLPFCPMYGIAGLLIHHITNYQDNIFIIFILSIIISIIIEYTTSYLMEKIYHHKWWDYKRKKYNLKGRICLINTIEFGILGIIVKYLNPSLTSLTIPNSIITIVTILFIIDLIISTIYTYIITNNHKYNKNFLTKKINYKLNNIP